MISFEAALAEQTAVATARVAERTKERRRRIETLDEPGGLALADAPERVAARLDRLSRYLPDVRPVSPSKLINEDPEAVQAAGKVLERVIAKADFVGVRYLEVGAAAGRAVVRVIIRDGRGRVTGYGSGSLVSPELVLTNHHVLQDAESAGRSVIEFDFQDGVDGLPLPPVRFELDPQRCFLADKDLDYALVAVAATAGDLAPFGFNPIIPVEGKAIAGEYVSIIQHPGGEKKQVVLRENKIVDVAELVLHYEADTERGSSGSPVFNDQWEVVALHHASVPAPEHPELGVVNEGIRISRIAAHTRRQAPTLAPTARALIDALFADPSGPTTASSRSRVEGLPGLAVSTAPRLQVAAAEPTRVTIPLEITVRTDGEDTAARRGASEAVEIDPDYTTRRGYDPEFLGTGPLRVPLPNLPDDLASLAATNTQATSDPRYVLPYHHFSVAMHKQRRLALFTAVNIDGATSARLRRERDRWIVDPRLPVDEQTGEDVYRNNPLDRGHLVRRLDPAWGGSRAAAKAANDDTFHFTNCTPQHKDFNQNRTTSAGLEDYILENADNRDLRVNVLTGPVMADDDEPYRDVALPRQFWKIVAMVKDTGELSATGYLLSQDELIRGLEVVDLETFSYGAYRTYQVPIERIQGLTGLSFGDLPDADPLTRLETTPAAVEITDHDQLVL